MKTKIALLNPANGQYEFFDTIELAKERFSKMCEEFFLLHTNNQPFSKVTTDDNGNDTWCAL